MRVMFRYVYKIIYNFQANKFLRLYLLFCIMLFIFDAITVHNGFRTLRADSERYIDNDRMMKFKPDPRSAHTLYDQLAAYVSD